VVTQVIAFEGNGVLREYAGGYDDWLLQRTRPAVEKPAAKAPADSKEAPAKPAAKSKLNWKEAQELAALPEQIRALEEEQTGVTARLSDGTLYVTQASEAKRLQARMVEIDAALESLLARWEALEAKQSA
jgi:ATP-binding cassette subfamily F protein uup